MVLILTNSKYYGTNLEEDVEREAVPCLAIGAIFLRLVTAVRENFMIVNGESSNIHSLNTSENWFKHGKLVHDRHFKNLHSF